MPKLPVAGPVSIVVISGFALTVAADRAADYVCDGIDDQVQINAAIAALPSVGGTVLLSGPLSINDSIVCGKTSVTLDGEGAVLSATSAMANKPMLRILNADYCTVSPGLFFLGNWVNGCSAIDIVGSVGSDINLRGDQLWYGIKAIATSAAGANRNVAMTNFDIVIRNGVNGMLFQGDNTYFASNNYINRIAWWGAGSVAGVGMDFVAYADNNNTRNAFLDLTKAATIGVRFNSSAPTSEVGVYENHWDGIIQAEVGGTIAFKGNRTDASSYIGPARLTCRLAGATPPSNSIAADCQLVQPVETAYS